MEENKAHYVRIAQACYLAADWPEDIVLYAGEVGWESDTKKFKVGDGTTPWKNLDYVDRDLVEKINSNSEKIQTNASDLEEFKKTFNNSIAIGKDSLVSAKAFKILECNGTDTYTIIIGALDSSGQTIFGYSAGDFAEEVVKPINANKSDNGDNLNEYSVNFKEHYDLLGLVESISDTRTKEITLLTKLALSTKLVDFGLPSDIVDDLDKFIVADVKVTNYRDDSELDYVFGTNVEMFRIPSLPEVGNIDIAQYAFAAGEGAKAKMNAAIALGYLSEAIGQFSFTAGKKTIAAGYASTSLGDENKVVGREGFACNIKNEVYGLQSYAEGRKNKVYGDRCHAQGGSNEITENASYSSVAGFCNKVDGDFQFVIGKFSDGTDTTSPFIIGYGTSDSDSGRKNIFKVKDTGVAWQLGTPKDPGDLVNKKYVDEAIVAAINNALKSNGSIAKAIKNAIDSAIGSVLNEGV